MNANIYIAFRFHGNFYHSYRGDTPDELGFGKDIRIIRYLIKTLDTFNAGGIPVCGTWDFENYFSLDKIMPAHCPDILADLVRRVRQGQDEVQLMSYNNGLISAHTAREFEESIRRGISNPAGSGLGDLFGEDFQGMVRPQEMMYTPIHLKLYKACGVGAISLFYSALPFNAFSNFIPPLSFCERYNPLTLAYPGIEETMTLLPCYNVGDLGDHVTLRRWVKGMRRQQSKLENPHDLLLLIDSDADDGFWAGFDIPILKRFFSTVRGLKGLVEDVADLDYVRFTTPGRYLKDHAPLGTISIGQDTADGSFDGYASWAEKWSNQRLWTGLERARILELQTLRLNPGDLPEDTCDLLVESFEARLKALSTTHFGLSTPVMNLTRERAARGLVDQAVKTAAAAFERNASQPTQGEFSLLDYVRGDSTELVQYQAHPSRGLVRLSLREKAPESFTLKNADGRTIPCAVLQTGERRELLFVEDFQPAERRDYTIEAGQAGPPLTSPVRVSSDTLQNEFLQLTLDACGHLTSLQADGEAFALGRWVNSCVTYAGVRYQVETWTEVQSLALGVVGLKRMWGRIRLKGGYQAAFEREVMLAAGLPYVYLSLRAVYPGTPFTRANPAKIQRLEQAWDQRWQEVMPCEISPLLGGKLGRPLRVWKHNYCDHVSRFELDYGRFSANHALSSVNNQVTHAWVAVSDGQRGLLVAQNADTLSNMAFCPLRTWRQGEITRIRFNPFGTYWGQQYRYATADTGLGNLLATTFSAADHIGSYAPSYNGRQQVFRLLLAPYRGDAPPETTRWDAEAFGYPYLVLQDGEWVASPPHRSWDGNGLGERPSP